MLLCLAGCAATADDARRAEEDPATAATPLTLRAGGDGAPSPFRDGKPSIGEVARDEGDTDVRLYEPPKLVVPQLDLSDPGIRWPRRDEGEELSYGACLVNCSVMTMQRIFDPSRGSPVFIPVVVCD